MTQEDKELLLKDLSARLPYGVICNDNRHGSGRVTNIDITPDDIEHKNPKVVLYYFDFDECGGLKNCKPYLRSMSSMTEEEKKEFLSFFPGCLGDQWLDLERETVELYECSRTIKLYISDNVCMIDWLNAHHFDYRGLIPMGLALEAPEGMYKMEE